MTEDYFYNKVKDLIRFNVSVNDKVVVDVILSNSITFIYENIEDYVSSIAYLTATQIKVEKFQLNIRLGKRPPIAFRIDLTTQQVACHAFCINAHMGYNAYIGIRTYPQYFLDLKRGDRAASLAMLVVVTNTIPELVPLLA